MGFVVHFVLDCMNIVRFVYVKVVATVIQESPMRTT